MPILAGAITVIEAGVRQVQDTQHPVVTAPRYAACLPWLAGIAALNVALLWAVALRRGRTRKASMLTVAGLAFVVSIALHIVGFVLKGTEFAFAWAMLTVPLLWCFGFLVNLVAAAAWERLTQRHG